MSSQNSKCSCSECDDSARYEKLSEVIAKYKDREGSLIQVLHIAQSLFGYLSPEVQQYIAEGLSKPLSEVTGVTSFYSLFSTEPKGRHTISVCLGTACYVRGGKKIISKLEELLGVDVGGTTEDGRFTFRATGCIGACGLAPAMLIDEKIYKQVNPDRLEHILAAFE
jgi:NADH:ubiquinone oxidoreductase subunit E